MTNRLSRFFDVDGEGGIVERIQRKVDHILFKADQILQDQTPFAYQDPRVENLRACCLELSAINLFCADCVVAVNEDPEGPEEKFSEQEVAEVRENFRGFDDSDIQNVSEAYLDEERLNRKTMIDCEERLEEYSKGIDDLNMDAAVKLGRTSELTAWQQVMSPIYRPAEGHFTVNDLIALLEITDRHPQFLPVKDFLDRNPYPDAEDNPGPEGDDPDLRNG